MAEYTEYTEYTDEQMYDLVMDGGITKDEINAGKFKVIGERAWWRIGGLRIGKFWEINWDERPAFRIVLGVGTVATEERIDLLWSDDLGSETYQILEESGILGEEFFRGRKVLETQNVETDTYTDYEGIERTYYRWPCWDYPPKWAGWWYLWIYPPHMYTVQHVKIFFISLLKEAWTSPLRHLVVPLAIIPLGILASSLLLVASGGIAIQQAALSQQTRHRRLRRNNGE